MVPAQESRAPYQRLPSTLWPETRDLKVAKTILFPIPLKEANNSHFLEKPPRSRGKRKRRGPLVLALQENPRAHGANSHNPI